MTGAANELLDRPAWSLRESLLAREITVTALVEATLDRISARDYALHSFVTVARDSALQDAARLDAEFSSRKQFGPLFGVPISVKDLFFVAGMRTTAGSRIFEKFVPTFDSVHAERLRAADAIIIGKTNTPEFAVFPRTVNLLQPETVNPWDEARSSGGSSGGAAASVAARLTSLAVGSDGGGSIRIPAALCGVVGIHPSRGLVPRHGGIGGTLLFSSAGPVATNVRDAATLLQVLAGPDDRDPLCLTTAPPDLLEQLDEPIRDLRVKWISDSGVDGGDDEVIESVATTAHEVKQLGWELIESDESLSADRWAAAFSCMMSADRFAALGEEVFEDHHARANLSAYAEEHFRAASTRTAADYSRALEQRFHAKRHMEQLFDGVDALLTPTVPLVAQKIDEPIERLPLVSFTFLVNYTGYAAATLPCGLIHGLPVGVQVIVRPGNERLLVRICRSIERLRPPFPPPTMMRTNV
jgi:Asp-tRNA(Asn)/Glu-tRNA(Gln) amidotransferase A subunit family amidase